MWPQSQWRFWTNKSDEDLKKKLHPYKRCKRYMKERSSMAQAVSRMPLITGDPCSRHGNLMWVSCGRNGIWTGSFEVSPFTTATNFIHHFSTLSWFFSFHLVLSAPVMCDRRGRTAPLLFTDLQYRGFIAFYLSTRPCAGHEEAGSWSR